ncbi:hypothetical protein NQ318_018760 [Aromia moschata]|uniref:Protein-cysteine N-palmitoyltransferase Rasp n=1 Tax=Aromia moschata TaxID=1265417 RepID=A0AAV8ZIF0_9CUCU|nr:hypothetical protein NQ318_018760 [Aromia moschata]
MSIHSVRLYSLSNMNRRGRVQTYRQAPNHSLYGNLRRCLPIVVAYGRRGQPLVGTRDELEMQTPLQIYLKSRTLCKAKSKGLSFCRTSRKGFVGVSSSVVSLQTASLKNASQSGNTLIGTLNSFTGLFTLCVPISYEDEFQDFTAGSPFISNKRDKADLEWESIYFSVFNIYPWILLYLFVSEIFRSVPSITKVFQLWQVCFAIFLIQITFGYLIVCVVLMQPIIFYLKHIISKSIISTWACTAGCLCLITYYRTFLEDFQEFSALNEIDLCLVTVCLFWLNLKCTSYHLEKQNGTKVLDFLSYCLYPPTMFSGPFVPLKDFQCVYNASSLPIHERLKKLVLNLARILFWFLFGHIYLHYVYVNATSFQPNFVKSFDNWSLNGYGYAMGQHFHIKYVVLYGLSTSCASYENINIPQLPRCIGRVHLYSDMWRYFDAGLYKFLVRHIYVPLMNKFSSKLLASFLCFLFIYVWHGVESSVLMWTVLNYLGITLEYACQSLNKKYFESEKNKKLLDPYWLRRLKCLSAAPLLMMSAVSNFYFFAGTQIGNIFCTKNFYGKYRQQRICYNCSVLLLPSFNGTTKSECQSNL